MSGLQIRDCFRKPAALLLVCLGGTVTTGADWAPPENPDPSKILSEAQQDSRAGRYADALAKHVWFHENALKHEPAQYGVRLSFALSSWSELGASYKPALTKLQQVRDDAGKEVAAAKESSKRLHELFHDYASINSTLGQGELTVSLFKQVAAKSNELAKGVFGIARPDLIRAKEFRLCGKYLEPETDFNSIAEGFRLDQEFVKTGQLAEDHMDFARKSYSNESATLIALLQVNGRKEEAAKVAVLAKKEWDDAAYHKLIDSALEGVVPEPWP